MHKLVSIIIPCYKQAQYLPEALDSVLHQTYPEWECIIVNDGSPDNVEEIAQEWVKKDDRFKYIKKENGGLSSARNAGLRMAAGEYIQFLDADDLLEKYKIEHQISYLENCNEKIDIVVSGYRYFQDSDKARRLQIFGPFNVLPEVIVNKEDEKDLVKLFARINPMVISAPLYHNSIFQRIGYFDEDLGANEDWDFHFRCAVNGVIFQHCGYSQSSKTLIRIHDKSMSADKRHMIKHLKKLHQKHKNNYIFALENGLILSNYRKRVLYFFKMNIIPVARWLLEKYF